MAAASYACSPNCTEAGFFPYNILGGTDAWSSWHEMVGYFSYNPWIFSLLGSTVVGLTGIFPLWLIPIQDGVDLKADENSGTLKILLSFAMGALLGDVFLHLLPEAFESELQTRARNNHSSMPAGLTVLLAFLFFVIIEKLGATINEGMAIIPENQIDETLINNVNKEKEMDNNNCITLNTEKNGFAKKCFKNSAEIQLGQILFLEKQYGKDIQTPNQIKGPRKNGFKDVDIMKSSLSSECPNDGPLVDEAKSCLKKLAKSNGFAATISRPNPPHVIPSNNMRLIAWIKKLTSNLFRKFFNPKAFPGYLNLLMNFLDNFTHGLSVGGSFLISFRVGVLSTFTILVHEIPHEVGDFAILLRSGFSRWDAARAQLFTAGGGIVGALAAVSFSGGLEQRTSWILPLTAGGFIHIGLMQETRICTFY
ncbi:Zinc transporter ZIP13 homolog [Camponotus japonicus]